MGKRKSFWKVFITRSVVIVLIAMLLSDIVGMIFKNAVFERMSDEVYDAANRSVSYIQKEISENPASANGNSLIDFLLASFVNYCNSAGSEAYAVFYDSETKEIIGNSDLSFFLIDPKNRIPNGEHIFYKCPYDSVDTTELDGDEAYTYLTKSECLTDRKFYLFAILPMLFDLSAPDYCPDLHSLEMKDYYIKEGTDSFYPGNCDVIPDIHDSFSNPEIMYSVNLTPEPEADFVKYDFEESGHPFFITVGSLPKEDSTAYRIFTENKDKWMNDDDFMDSCFGRTEGYPSEWIFKRDIFGPDGHRYEILSFSDATITSNYMRSMVFWFHVVFIIIGLLISLVWSLITIAKNRSLLRLIDYRKTLMNTMAHDLKTPLAAMSGYAENLKENVHTDKREHYADAICENSRYMDGIIADVLELSKTEDSIIAPVKEKIDLVSLAREIAAKYADEMEVKKLTLSADGSFTVKTDRTLYTRVFDNLLGNAVKYSKEGSEIKIKGDGSSIVIENEPEEQYKGNVKKLWEPFVKGDESRANKKGTGVGLSIARNIMSNTGFKGKIEVSENTFRVVVRKKKLL